MLEVPNELIATVLSATLQTKSIEDTTRMHNVSHDIQRLIKTLQDDPQFNRTLLAQLEWGFLNILDRKYSHTGPNTLVTELAASPQLFVEMLRLIYRGENEPEVVVEVSEQDLLKGRHANELLDGIDQLPGRTTDGELVIATLSSWIVDARQLARESGHLAVCDITIGRIIARDWKRFSPESGPSIEVAKLIEAPEIASDELFRGFVMGVINSDGVSFRSPTEGGKQERQKAERFRKLSDDIRPTSSRLANTFNVLAERYEASGAREDNDAEGIRLGRW